MERRRFLPQPALRNQSQPREHDDAAGEVLGINLGIVCCCLLICLIAHLISQTNSATSDNGGSEMLEGMIALTVSWPLLTDQCGLGFSREEFCSYEFDYFTHCTIEQYPALLLLMFQVRG